MHFSSTVLTSNCIRPRTPFPINVRLRCKEKDPGAFLHRASGTQFNEILTGINV